MSNFTKEQLQELETRYGLKPLEQKLKEWELKVRDGVVTTGVGMTVWWRYEYGPELVKVDDHIQNIKEYPEYYQIVQPEVEIVYKD